MCVTSFDLEWALLRLFLVMRGGATVTYRSMWRKRVVCRANERGLRRAQRSGRSKYARIQDDNGDGQMAGAKENAARRSKCQDEHD